MSIHQHATLEDTVYFWFGSNDTSGSGDDGASAAADVRLAGAAAGAIPVLSLSPTLLSHANYPAGAYEVAVAATEGNGFVDGNTYAVFCTLTVDSQNPTGFVGSFTLDPIIANVKQISDDSTAADNEEKFFDGTGYAGTNNVIPTVTTLTSHTAQTGDNYARLGGPAGASVSADVAAIKAETATIVVDTNELQTDDVPGLIAALNNISAADVNAQVDSAFTTQMADSVSTDGAIATREQALYMVLQLLSEFAISGTTMTVKKVDGSTSLLTLTLDDATNPTSITRAS